MMQMWAKKIFFVLADLLQLPRLSRWHARRQGTILLYHGVAPQKSFHATYNYRKKFIDPAVFRAQMMWIKKHYTVLPLSELLERQTAGTLPDYACAITFDDGYANNYEYAFPILRELQLSATIFVTTDFVDQKIPLWVDELEYAIGATRVQEIHVLGTTYPLTTRQERIAVDRHLRDALKCIEWPDAMQTLEHIVAQCGVPLRAMLAQSPYRALTWEQCAEMHHHSITIAPHTCTHPILSRLSPEEMQHEIAHSAARVSDMVGGNVSIFAYPNGGAADMNSTTTDLLRGYGFRYALTTISGHVTTITHPLQIPRFTLDATGFDAAFRMTATGARARFKK